jgi:hypothetical protein
MKAQEFVCKHVGWTILVAGLVFPAVLRAEPMVSVVEHAFCKDIANLGPTNIVSDSVSLRPGERLHLWVEVQINRAGLKYLKALGKLPVYVRWGRDGWLTDPPIDIGIYPDAWKSNQDGIQWKASQSGGVLKWRTHTDKAALAGGRYYASVLDANSKVITNIDLPTEPFRPEIVVSRE